MVETNFSQIHFRAGYRYQLAKTYLTSLEYVKPPTDIWFDWTCLTAGGFIEIRKDYAWDGPSGPAMDTKNAMRGSLVHDACYQLLRLGFLDPVLREAIDREYRRICREDGMSRLRAWIHFRALRRFASGAAEHKSERQIQTAP